MTRANQTRHLSRGSLLSPASGAGAARSDKTQAAPVTPYVVFPFRTDYGGWAYTDREKGRRYEGLVAGADKACDIMAGPEHFAFKLLFAGERFPGAVFHGDRLESMKPAPVETNQADDDQAIIMAGEDATQAEAEVIMASADWTPLPDSPVTIAGGGGTTYKIPAMDGLEVWLCPALFDYFPEGAPQTLWVGWETLPQARQGLVALAA